MPTIDSCKKILKEHWGYDDFRGIQQEIIENICAGHDTLGLMPTGGGKSITFQVPALAMEGTCLVITPLVSLMKDQVDNLRRHGIRAAAIHAGIARQDIIQILENCIFGATRILYVSPERLSSELFLAKLRHIKVSFITVDEAHCICQWGYDFRPSYLQIASIREVLPDAPVLALTATATPEVADDIQRQLAFRSMNVCRMSFERKNIAYIVRQTEDKGRELRHILSRVPGTAIVYVRSRKRAQETAAELERNGISATYYHAGLETVVKNKRQERWQKDETRVMVATNAFGMGIDKPNVRIVVHIDTPDSLEAYFQEAGRAGRDGEKAYAVLLYNGQDSAKMRKHVAEAFPKKDYIRKVYEHLAYFYQIGVESGAGHAYPFNIEKFCHTFKHFPVQVESALKILQQCGYLEYEEEDESRARIMFTVSRATLYLLDGQTPLEDKIITFILRNYTGVFSEYVYIDEAYIAQEVGTEIHKVYLTLQNLDRRNVVRFVPQRKDPYVRYTRDRVDPEDIVIPPSIYEQRLRQYKKRIESVISYAETEHICRSRMLLKYFGEKRHENCGMCDVCLEKRGKDIPAEQVEKTQQDIITMLSDGKLHSADELNAIDADDDIMQEALRRLLFEEKIYSLDGMLTLHV